MKRAALILCLVVVISAVGAPPGRASLRRGNIISNVQLVTPSVFPLPGDGFLVSIPTRGENRSQYLFNLAEGGRGGKVRWLGSYRIELAGLGTGEMQIRNRTPVLRYLIVPAKGGYLFIYEKLKTSGWKAEKVGSQNSLRQAQQEMAVGFLLLGPGGRVIPRGELLLRDLVKLEPPTYGVSVILGDMSADREGRRLVLVLIARDDRVGKSQLYRVEVDLGKLDPLGKGKPLGELCDSCLVSLSADEMVVGQLSSPVVEIRPLGKGHHYLMATTTLEPGPNWGRVYQEWNKILFPNPLRFGKGWISEPPVPFQTWVRLGETWYRSHSRSSEIVVARLDGEGRLVRLTRLPRNWELGRSKDPNRVLFYLQQADRQVVVLDTEGDLYPLRVDHESGRVSRARLATWMLRRFEILARQPFDLTPYGLPKGKKLRSDQVVTVVPGPDAVGLLHDSPPQRDLNHLRVVTYRGEPLYEVSWNSRTLYDFGTLRPEQMAEEGKFIYQPPSFMPTSEGVYLIYKLEWMGKPKQEWPGQGAKDFAHFIRFALLRLSPEGEVSLLGLINLEELADKAGLVLKTQSVELEGDTMITHALTGDALANLIFAQSGEGVKTFLELGLGGGAVRYRYDAYLDQPVAREGVPPGILLYTPSRAVCLLELKGPSLGDCYPEVPSQERMIFGDSGMFLFPTPAKKLTDLSLRSPVFFQGWASYQEEGGSAIPLDNFTQRVDVKAYSGIGFLGTLTMPGRVGFLHHVMRPGRGLHKLLCRWDEEGKVRACMKLPSGASLAAADPEGSGVFWLNVFSWDKGNFALLVDRDRGTGTAFYGRGRRLVREEFNPPYIRYLIESIAGPVDWKPLPRVVFSLHPGEVPNYRKLIGAK